MAKTNNDITKVNRFECVGTFKGYAMGSYGYPELVVTVPSFAATEAPVALHIQLTQSIDFIPRFGMSIKAEGFAKHLAFKHDESGTFVNATLLMGTNITPAKSMLMEEFGVEGKDLAVPYMKVALKGIYTPLKNGKSFVIETAPSAKGKRPERVMVSPTRGLSLKGCKPGDEVACICTMTSDDNDTKNPLTTHREMLLCQDIVSLSAIERRNSIAKREDEALKNTAANAGKDQKTEASPDAAVTEVSSMIPSVDAVPAPAITEIDDDSLESLVFES